MKKNLIYFFFFSLLLGNIACKKQGDKLENQPPITRIAYEIINLSGENRLPSIVKLSWYGTDPDGFVTGYEYSIDAINWIFTAQRDSTFRFNLPDGNDTFNVDFYVRAIDNEGLADPNPAYLAIPIKNSNPQISINRAFEPFELVPLIATFGYNATDPDGTETITDIQIKINGGDWFSISNRAPVFSIIPNEPLSQGPSTAKIIVDGIPSSASINGLNLNDSNTIYIRCFDNAGAPSNIDTTKTIFITNKQNDLLFISGHEQNQTTIYKSYLNKLNINYDFIDYGRNTGIEQPRYWATTFPLLLNFYQQLFLAESGFIYQNAATGATGSILEFAAAGLNSFINNNGKLLVSARFNQNSDVRAIAGVMPLDTLEFVPGLIRILSNDSVTSTQTNFPSLRPKAVILRPSLFKPTPDAGILYRAGITVVSGNYSGDNVIGAFRPRTGKMNQVFIGLQLHEFRDEDVEKLLDRIINDEFN